MLPQCPRRWIGNPTCSSKSFLSGRLPGAVRLVSVSSRGDPREGRGENVNPAQTVTLSHTPLPRLAASLERLLGSGSGPGWPAPPGETRQVGAVLHGDSINQSHPLCPLTSFRLAEPSEPRLVSSG
jgi:hypothetical protein